MCTRAGESLYFARGFPAVAPIPLFPDETPIIMMGLAIVRIITVSGIPMINGYFIDIFTYSTNSF